LLSGYRLENAEQLERDSDGRERDGRVSGGQVSDEHMLLSLEEGYKLGVISYVMCELSLETLIFLMGNFFLGCGEFLHEYEQVGDLLIQLQ
jgi:hypothetical protein